VLQENHIKNGTERKDYRAGQIAKVKAQQDPHALFGCELEKNKCTLKISGMTQSCFKNHMH